MTDAELAEVLNIPEEAVKRLDPALPFAPGGGSQVSHVSHPRARPWRGCRRCRMCRIRGVALAEAEKVIDGLGKR
jgi:hypothetical protein